jgi:N-acetylglucosamine kinase-like BadF-type ATPase
VDETLALGIDGGGTGTVALLERGGVVIGRGEAGPSNRQAVGDAQAMAALDESVSRAFAAAGIERVTVGAACLGLAGSGRAEDREVVLLWARRVRLAERTDVTTDAALLLAAGTPTGWGLALVAGTGSIAWGRAADGREDRAGGWGYLLGDKGSGYSIALAALRAIVRSADSALPPTVLGERLLGHLRLNDTQALVPLIYGGGMDRAALAGLAPLVIDCSDDDSVAADIVQTQARELARTAAATAKKLGFGDQAFPLALAGGLLLGCESYRRLVLEALVEDGLRPEPVTLVHEPAEGALRLARAP